GRKEEQTDDPEFKVFLKDLPTQRVLGSGSQTSNTTTINIQGSGLANILKKGHAVLNERTLEVMWVSADPTSPFNSFSATRGRGSTAAALNDGDGLLIVGSHHMEGVAAPSALASGAAAHPARTLLFRV